MEGPATKAEKKAGCSRLIAATAYDASQDAGVPAAPASGGCALRPEARPARIRPPCPSAELNAAGTSG